MYMRMFGCYTREKYHESNDAKLREFGPVVREDVIWNFPLIHIFDSQVGKQCKHNSTALAEC